MNTLIARLKHPEDHYEITDPKKANAVLMSLCQEAADAQPAPVQPVAILNHAHGVYAFRSVNLQGLPDGEYQVYTTPPAAQPPAQEFTCSTGLCHYKAQRQWAGLTDEEFIDLCEEASNFGTGGLIRHIEAKLKEKNQ